MTDVRLPASGNIKLRWHAINAFAVPGKPTPAEVNAGLVLDNAVSWNDFDFGIQASSTNSDPALSAKSNTSDRGAMQFGGNISTYLPAELGSGDEYDLAHAALKDARTLGWISIQVDGELSETGTATYAGGLTKNAASGDLISLFKVMTAGYSNSIKGEEAFRETISFLSQGEAYVDAVVATTLTVAVTPSTGGGTAGTKVALAATVNARPFTHGVRWSSSDSTKATVSQNGVVTCVASGTATITATYQGATSTATITVT